MEDEDYEELEEASESESNEEEKSSDSKNMSSYQLYYKKQTMKEYENDWEKDKGALMKAVK